MSQRQNSLTRKKSKKAAIIRKAVVEDTLLLNVVQSYFKKAAVVLAVWTAGYFRFSPAWLLFGLVVYVWKERNSTAEKHAIAVSQEVARDEKGVILARVEDLPTWVCFPDVERAEWVNKMICQMWPYIGEYVKDLLKNTIEPKIRISLPPSFGSFKFSKIDLGDIPPRIGGIKVYTTEVHRDEIYMDLELNYASDCNIAVNIKGINAGIKGFTLHGTLRVIFRPLINKVPMFGGMSIFFLNNPKINFDLTSLANAFDLPGLSDMLHAIVQEQIAAIMVLPNRIPIQMVNNVDIRKLRYPQPQGVLRIHVIEAKDLMKADIGITGKGKSDPYTIVSVGAQVCHTKVIDNTVFPKWDQVFEFIVDERDGQIVSFDLKDKDPGNKDDHLGSTSLDITSIFEKGTVDEWLPLEDVKKGLVHIRATWLYLANDPLELDRVDQQVQESGLDRDSVNTALLIVNLDCANDLPRGKKTLAEPSPQAFLTVGQKTVESTIRANTTEPRWEENFRLFVANPNHQMLLIELRDTKTKKEIGQTSVKLKELLQVEDMILDKKFPLKTTEPGSSIRMMLILRILTPEANPEWLESENPFSETTGAAGDGTSVDAAEGQKGSGVDPNRVPTPTDTPTGKAGAPGEIVSEVIQPVSKSPPAESDLRQRKAVSPTTSAPTTVSTSEAGSQGLGRIQLTFRYSMQRQRLVVVIHKIVNLKAAEGDSKGLADPYVKMHLLPDRDSKSKRKTEVVKDNLNPVFDQTFEYPVHPNELSSKSLELSVKNETGLFSSSQTLLGMVLVDLSTLDTSRAVTQWFDLSTQQALRSSTLETEKCE